MSGYIANQVELVAALQKVDEDAHIKNQLYLIARSWERSETALQSFTVLEDARNKIDEMMWLGAASCEEGDALRLIASKTKARSDHVFDQINEEVALRRLLIRNIAEYKAQATKT